MLWRSRFESTDYDSDWEDPPPQDPYFQWGLGLIFPLAITCYGIHAIIIKSIDFGDEVRVTFHGSNAIAAGIAWVCAGVFLHCHYFLGNLYDQVWFAVLGKIIAAIGFIAGLVFLLIHNGILGLS